MPTVIDSLVIELGLDTSKFNESQRSAVEQLRKFGSETTKSVDPAEKAFNNLAVSFKEIQGRLLAIGALIASGLGFNRLTQEVTKANTELGFLSKTLGMTAQDLSAWEQAGRTVGATAEEMKSNLAALNSEIQEFHATGRSELAALMGQLGIKNLQANDTPESVAKRLSQWYVQQPDKAFASHLLQTRGHMSQGMINMLGLGPEELQKRLDQAKKFAPTNQEIEQFQKLTKAFGELMQVVDKLARQIVDFFAPGLTRVLTIVTDFLDKISGGKNPAVAAGEGLSGAMPELAPKASKPSLFARGWDWVKNKWSGGGGGGAANDNRASPGGASGGAAGSSPGAVPEGASDFLRQQRQSFTDQLNDPAVRQRVAGMAVTEGASDPVPVVESLANRFGYVNEDRARRGLPPLTVDQMLTSGFYGPINRGELPGAINRLNGNPALARRMEGAISAVSAGSNTIRGATDQGLPTDPNGMWQGGRVTRGGNIFNDWGGGPGGHAGAQAYRERLMSGVAAGTVQGSPSAPGAPSLSLPGGTNGAFQRWRDMGLGARGALGNGPTTNSNTNTSQTNIHSMNVTVPQGASPSAYADGIQRRLSDYDNIQNSNTGMV